MHPDSNPSKAHAIEFRGDFLMNATDMNATDMNATVWMQDSDIFQAAEIRLRRS